MSEMAMGEAATARAPWQLWAVGTLALLWNAAGALTIMTAQSGAPIDMDPAEFAYHATQPGWFTGLTDVALVSAVLAAVAMLVRSRWALPLYGLSIAAIVVTSAYDLAAGSALLLHDRGD